MGENSIFECRSCGYKTPIVRWGVSVNDPRQRFMPALCLHCAAIIEVDLTGRDILVERFTCPDCGSGIIFFERSQSYNCPRCQAPDLTINQEGYW